MILMKQSRASTSCQAIFSNFQCATHVGVVSNMFQTSNVQLILIFSVLKCEAALIAPPLQHLRQCFTRAIQSKPSSMAAKPPPMALMDASAKRAGRPFGTHGVEGLVLEATKDHLLSKWVNGGRQPHWPSKTILLIVRICKKAGESFAWPQKGFPVRCIDGDERQLSRLATLVWSEADEVAAELEELTKSQVARRVGMCGREGVPIQQVTEFTMSFAHLHHADFDMRFRKKLTKRWLLRFMMICKRGPAVRCPPALNVVRSLMDEDES